ncbi:hypothetical protein CVD28_14940 [Bacillus sp. M6-12]|nr:hypothetical protein CVD28_14940 [Bacillus sp. M6-12]
MMNIRKAVPGDAKRLLNLMNAVDNSNLMLYGPGERQTTVEEQRKRIENFNAQEFSEIFIADINGELAGYLIIIGNGLARVKHSIYLVVGVSEQFRNGGIGTKLFE